jgi:hypothetical protein
MLLRPLRQIPAKELALTEAEGVEQHVELTCRPIYLWQVSLSTTRSIAFR